MIRMLMEREPAPIIDVTKPALPKRVTVDPADPVGDTTVAHLVWRDEKGNVHQKPVPFKEMYPPVPPVEPMSAKQFPILAEAIGMLRRERAGETVDWDSLAKNPAPPHLSRADLIEAIATQREAPPVNVFAGTTYKAGEPVMARPFGNAWFPAEYREPYKDCHKTRALTGEPWIHTAAQIRRPTPEEMVQYWPEPEKPAATDGWIPWNGGDCPVDAHAIIQRKYRDGADGFMKAPAAYFRWSHLGDDRDITAYRVVG